MMMRLQCILVSAVLSHKMHPDYEWENRTFLIAMNDRQKDATTGLTIHGDYSCICIPIVYCRQNTQ